MNLFKVLGFAAFFAASASAKVIYYQPGYVATGPAAVPVQGYAAANQAAQAQMQAQLNALIAQQQAVIAAQRGGAAQPVVYQVAAAPAVPAAPAVVAVAPTASLDEVMATMNHVLGIVKAILPAENQAELAKVEAIQQSVLAAVAEGTARNPAIGPNEVNQIVTDALAIMKAELPAAEAAKVDQLRQATLELALDPALNNPVFRNSPAVQQKTMTRILDMVAPFIAGVDRATLERAANQVLANPAAYTNSASALEASLALVAELSAGDAKALADLDILRRLIKAGVDSGIDFQALAAANPASFVPGSSNQVIPGLGANATPEEIELTINKALELAKLFFPDAGSAASGTPEQKIEQLVKLSQFAQQQGISLQQGLALL